MWTHDAIADKPPGVRGHCIVTLNGEDVTARTRQCNTRTGRIVLYQLNEAGEKFFDYKTKDVAVEKRRGRVRVEPK